MCKNKKEQEGPTFFRSSKAVSVSPMGLPSLRLYPGTLGRVNRGLYIPLLYLVRLIPRSLAEIFYLLPSRNEQCGGSGMQDGRRWASPEQAYHQQPVVRERPGSAVGLGENETPPMRDE
ncbi:hypothetical protein KQX54_016056 [Cotesia glomerata]|uniref:Uncharacterized protein n=1 Tax=Cotesia glomerata TaxID=32391 RepID=A0AAV7HX71_COTGL|nr:hypothetical protein KQX54_016056 [Cotesia glomerata]